MRALAEFAMRGRGQAILVAVLAIVVPFFTWVGAAVVGLVALRRGTREGLLVLGWSLLAALVVALWRGDMGPMAALLGTVGACLVLRWTISWPYALVATVLAGVLVGVLLLTVGSTYVQHLLEALNKLFEQVRAQMPAQQAAELGNLSVAQLSGFLGFRTTCAAVAGTLLARWWQAMLYNPGGFREEFHRLRLPLSVAAALLLVGGLLAALAGVEYRVWALPFAVPFIVAGFALAHGVVGLKGWGRAPLVALYVSWFLLWELVTIGLLLAALLDSGFDFRERLRKRAQ
jgi:hypothetical protein